MFVILTVDAVGQVADYRQKMVWGKFQYNSHFPCQPGHLTGTVNLCLVHSISSFLFCYVRSLHPTTKHFKCQFSCIFHSYKTS
ncbi:hypothetical protein NP493_261g00012 [Ridgeia piscesae]|uniref:Uncharacterized protein n=1 Tax=Ridgeia piscesae TaxID=27915 RepID=A0AAD9NY16_RIDPI|nr:hypothetical protein NP493_261g00012 [Ridgeia piscesae]